MNSRLTGWLAADSIATTFDGTTFVQRFLLPKCRGFYLLSFGKPEYCTSGRVPGCNIRALDSMRRLREHCEAVLSTYAFAQRPKPLQIPRRVYVELDTGMRHYVRLYAQRLSALKVHMKSMAVVAEPNQIGWRGDEQIGAFTFIVGRECQRIHGEKARGTAARSLPRAHRRAE